MHIFHLILSICNLYLKLYYTVHTFFRNQKDTMVKNKIEYYESKIKRLKENYLEELQEKNRKIAVIQFFLFFIYFLIILVFYLHLFPES